jgi:hypothetical protein
MTAAGYIPPTPAQRIAIQRRRLTEARASGFLLSSQRNHDRELSRMWAAWCVENSRALVTVHRYLAQAEAARVAMRLVNVELAGVELRLETAERRFTADGVIALGHALAETALPATSPWTLAPSRFSAGAVPVGIDLALASRLVEIAANPWLAALRTNVESLEGGVD